MHTLKITLEGNDYMATFSDPRTKELFGTDKIQTPFSKGYPVDKMLALLQERNPDCEVIINTPLHKTLKAD